MCSSFPRPPAALSPLLALLLGGCATVLDPPPPMLRIHTGSVVATVRGADGRTLGTTPFARRVPVREQQRLVIAAPGYDSAVVTVGRRPKEVLVTLINPLSWLVDGATGAVWRHDPDLLAISLSASSAPPAAASAAGEALPDAAAAAVLDAFADAAQRAGCEPLLVGAWRDAARVLEDGAAPAPDSVRRIAAEEVRRAAPEIHSLCARPSPRLEALRAIRATVSGPGDAVEPGPPPLAPVAFAANAWEIRDDSLRTRLRALGARLADAPVTVVVEGFADADELRHRELGYQRAMSVIRELRRGGMRADCCVAIGHADVAADGAGGRQVTLTLDYEGTP